MNKYLKRALVGMAVGLLFTVLRISVNGSVSPTRYNGPSPVTYAQSPQDSRQTIGSALSECDPRYILPPEKPSRALRAGEYAKFEDVVIDPRESGECENNPGFYGWHKSGL